MRKELDQGRLEVFPGDGLVGRLPGVVFAVQAHGLPSAEVRLLVDRCRDASANDTPAPALGEALRSSALFTAPPFEVVTQDGGALVVFVRGRARLTVLGEGYEIEVGGRAPAALIEKRFPLPLRALYDAPGESDGNAHRWLNLKRGIVPGGGLRLSLTDSREPGARRP